MQKLVIISLMLTALIYPQAKKLTLTESLELGFQNSKELKISKSKLISSDAKISEVNSQFFPQLKFFANYTRLSDNVPPFEVRVPFSPLPIKISDPIPDNYNLKFSFQQPLFTGFKLLASKKAANYNRDAAQLDYAKDKNEVAFLIINAFWNYYKVQEVRNLIDETLKQIGQHLNDTKNFLDNGMATENDYLKLEVLYSNTKLQLIEANNNVDIARAVFNKSLGLPLESKTEISIEDISIVPVDFNINKLFSEAKANRDELKSLAYKVKASEENVTAAKSGWFPSIFLTGNYYYSNPNPRFQPPVAYFNNTWDAGITLTWDLWNWGLTSSQTTQAEESMLQAKTTLESLTDAVEIDVYKSYLNLLKSKEKVDVSRLSLKQASENYRITSEKYDAHLATSTDLIDAEVSQLQAATNLKTALVEYELATVSLNKSLGRIIYK